MAAERCDDPAFEGSEGRMRKIFDRLDQNDIAIADDRVRATVDDSGGIPQAFKYRRGRHRDSLFTPIRFDPVVKNADHRHDQCFRARQHESRRYTLGAGAVRHQHNPRRIAAVLAQAACIDLVSVERNHRIAIAGFPLQRSKHQLPRESE